MDVPVPAPGSERKRSRVLLPALAAVVVVSFLGVELDLTPAAPVAHADPATGPGLFTRTTAGNITGTPAVPDGTCSARVSALGGGGASSASLGATVTGGRGGPGAQINATYSVLPLQVYGGSVGGGGAVARTGGTGGGGTGTDATNHDGAGGGGRSVVTFAGVTSVVAGGGGGGGAAHNNTPAGIGGSAGSALSTPGVAIGGNGGNGTDTIGVPGGGTGGQAAAGGAGGVHTTQTARNGTAGGGTTTGTGGNGGSDTTEDGAGGGGAGYTGGGGGASTVGSNVTGAGGGGGSSFVAATSPVAAATAPSAVSGSPGTTAGAAAAGATGSVSIDWLPCLYDLRLTKTPSPTTVRAGGKVTWTISITNDGPDPMTRGDTLTLTDTLPPGPNAATPAPANRVVSMTTTGGSNTNLTRPAITCVGLAVGSSMPASTTCTRPYAGVAGTPGAPSGGTRGLDVGETLTIVYEQVIANTAPCGSITNTATVVDRPTQTGTTDIVGQTATNSAPGTVTIQCYDLEVTKVASPKPRVAQAGTITWTITVRNLGPADMVGPDATVANPLVVTDTFPTTGVGTPVLTSSVGPAGACTRSGSTITCPSGLNAGQTQVLTFTQSVNAAATVGSTISNTASVTDFAAGDSNDSSTDSTQVAARPRIVLQKSLGAQSRINAGDQFVMTIGGTGGGSATTSGAGSTITGGTVTASPATAGATYTLSEAMASGSASALGQYANSIACTNTAAGSTTVLPTGPGTSFNLVPQLNDDITCTFTNTPRAAIVRVSKVSTGGIGSFGFTMTNLSSASTSVTTTAIGTPATSAAFTASAVNTPVVVTESVPVGWRLTGASCVDANAAVTGNPGSFGSLIGSALTIPAAFVEPAADITCTFSDLKLARLVIQKAAVGAGGTFDYTATGGLSPSAFSLSPDPPATPVASRTFADLSPGGYTVTEAPSASFRLTTIICADSPTGAVGSANTTDPATGLLSVTLVAGAEYTCTFSNSRLPNVTKTAGTVVGPAANGEYTVSYSVAVDNPGGATTYGALVDTPSFAPNLQVLRASWVTSASSGPAPPAGSATGEGPFTLAVPGQPLGAGVTHTYQVTVTFSFLTITAATACDGPGTGLYNTVTLDSPELTTVDNSACAPPPEPPSPAIDLGKSVTPTTVTALDQVLDFAFVVTNPGNVTLTGVVVSDPLPGLGAISCPSTVLVPAGSMTCSASYVVTQADIDNGGLTNVATVTGSPPAGPSVSDGATATVDATPLPSLELSKFAVPDNVATADQAVGYSFVVSNNGNVTLNAIQVTDPLVGLSPITCPGTQLAPGGSMTCNASYEVTQADVDAGGFENTATVSATPAAGPNVTDSATATVTATRTPSIDLTKSAVPNSVTAADQTVDFSFVVTNTGNVTLTGVVVTDLLPGLGAIGCPGTVLLPGGSMTCTASYEVTQADVDAGGFGNTASVTATPPAGPNVGDSANASVTATRTPSIDLVKVAAPGSVSAAEQVVEFSFDITNTGNVTLTDVVVTDPFAGLSAIGCPASELAPSGSMTCTAAYEVTQADIDAGGFGNTASVTATPPAGPNVGDSANASVTATRTPSIDLVKLAVPGTVGAAGQTVDFSFVVTNTGNVTLTNVAVTDLLPGLIGLGCPASALAPGGSMTCTAAYEVTQADIDAGGFDNTASVTATPPAGPDVDDTATATVTAATSQSIDLVKLAVPGTVTGADQPVTYQFIVTNAGNVTLSGIAISDPLPGLGSIVCPGTVLAPDGSMMCTATYTVTQADVDAGGLTNEATVSASPPSGASVTDSSTATLTATRSPAIDLTKAAVPATVTGADQEVTYEFVVTNSGNVTLTAIAVADLVPAIGTVSCPATELVPEASMSCTTTYTVTQDDVDAGGFANSATVRGTPPDGPDVTDTATAAVTAIRSPSIDLVKFAEPGTVSAADQVVTYSFVVTNTGNVTLSGVLVIDPLPGLSDVVCPATVLAPSTATTCSATYSVSQTDVDAGGFTNTATVTATSAAGSSLSDSETVSVSATRSPSIDLVKLATPTEVDGPDQVVTYSFVITNTGNVTLVDVTVFDELPGLSPIDCPDAVLAPSDTTTCTATYVVDQADIDSGGVSNTATVVGTPPAGPDVIDTETETVTSSQHASFAFSMSATPTTVTAAGQTVTYTFAATNTGNVTVTGITVSDLLVGVGPIDCPATELAPAASMTCTAVYAVTQADVDVGGFTNTATVTGTSPIVGPSVNTFIRAFAVQAAAAGDVSATASVTVTALATPGVELVKSASPGALAGAGQVVTFSFITTNVGNVTLSNLAVFDPMPGLGPISCPGTVVAPGESMTCTATYTVTQADVDARIVSNTATVSGTAPIGGSAVSDTASFSLRPGLGGAPGPGVALVKSVSPEVVTSAGQLLTFSFLVVNTGIVTLTEIVVTDPMPNLSPVVCLAQSLAPGQSFTCAATYVATQSDIDNGLISNRATVTASAAGETERLLVEAEVSVMVAAAPSLTLTKTVSPSVVTSGSSVTFGFVITNTGNVTLTGVVLADQLPGLSPLNCGTFDGELAPGESVSCTATYVALGSNAEAGVIRNEASVSASGAGTIVSTADATAVLRVRAGTLPSTGGDVGRMLVGGLASVVAGLCALFAGRRRTTSGA